MTLLLVGLSLLVDLVSLGSGLVPLEAGERVYPSRGNGFAAAILGALVALGLLVVMMIFISSKPRNRRR